MTNETDYIVEADIRFELFNCCGDEDLYPFGCPSCGHLMVFCYECDTLYEDLNDLAIQNGNVNHFDPKKPIFPCPKCGFEFEYYFMKNSAYRISRNDWNKANLNALLN